MPQQHILNLSLIALAFAIGCEKTDQPASEKPQWQREKIPQAAANDQSSTQTAGEIVFSKQKYTFTLSELAQGITIDYQLVLRDEIENAYLYQYDLSGNGPIPTATVEGNGQYYGLDDGGGAPPIWIPNTIKQGTYSHTFEWDGRNWTGPSDWGNPKGGPFPAGIYKLSIVCGRSKPLDESDPSPASTEILLICHGVAIVEIVND